MKKKAPTEKARELTDFAPAVYVKFMRENMFLYGRDIVGELIRLEAEIEHEEIRKKIDRIIDQKSEPIPKDLTPEEILKRLKKVREESAALDRMWARQDELRAIMYPEIERERREVT